MCLPRPLLPPYKSLPFFDGLNWKRFLSEQKGDEEATVTPPTRGFIVAECWGAFVPLMCGEKCLIIFMLLLMSRGSIVLTRMGFPFWCVAYHHVLLTIMSLKSTCSSIYFLSIYILKVFFGVLFNVDVVSLLMRNASLIQAVDDLPLYFPIPHKTPKNVRQLAYTFNLIFNKYIVWKVEKTMKLV